MDGHTPVKYYRRHSNQSQPQTQPRFRKITLFMNKNSDSSDDHRDRNKSNDKFSHLSGFVTITLTNDISKIIIFASDCER